MKKILLILISFILLVSCSSKKEKEENILITQEKVINKTELILNMINQCIDDYNNDLILEREKEWSTTIKPLPIGIENIENIKSLDDIVSRKIDNNINSAVFIGEYKVNNYKMIFEIYNYGTNFWLNGKSNFEIDVNTITLNNSEFSNIKQTLDSLLKENRNIIKLLYGLNVEIYEDDLNNNGYYKVKNFQYNLKSINDIKQKAETIFTKEYLEKIYDISFNKENSIYKEIKGELFVYLTDDTNLYNGLPYDTSRIINIKELQDKILVDLVISFDDDVINEVQRITLIKTENGLRLDNTY